MTILMVPFPLTVADEDIAVRTIVGEIRGGTLEQMQNVAWVLRNRLEDHRRFDAHNTLARVCLWPAQFSCWNSGDPNFGVLHTTGVHDKVYREARLAFLAVREADNATDPTRGACHYYAKSMAVPPAWVHATAASLSLDDGKHLFFCNVP